MSRFLREFSSMLPNFYMELWNSVSSPGPIGGHGTIQGGGSGGAGSAGSSSSASSVLALHDVAKPLGHVLQLGQQAQNVLADSGRNAAINSARAGASFGVRRTSARGMGSNNTPIAFFGGGAMEGRGGPSAT